MRGKCSPCIDYIFGGAAPWPAAWGSGAFIFTYLKCIFINMCTAHGTYG